MKPRLRLWLLLLLGFALPVSGMAQLLTQELCPMAQAEAAMSGVMDCCQEQDDARPDDGACKSGQQCKTASLLQIALPDSPLLCASTTRFASLPSVVLHGSGADVWRPPQS